MSLRESAARAVVRISASMLPRASRGRYREQWLADLRDAEEVGLPRRQIVLAALAFAVTTSHPWPERPALGEMQIERRSRLAQGLALGAALLGLSQYATIIPDRDFSGNPPDYGSFAPIISVCTGTILGFAVVAAVLAVLLVFATRGVDARVCVAVGLLVLVTCVPLAQSVVANLEYESFEEYLRPSAVPYLLGAVAAAAAAFLLWRARARPNGPARAPGALAVVGGMIVALFVGSGVVVAASIWSHRRAIVWTPNAADGPARLSNPYYAQWLWMKNYFEGLVNATFLWWAVAGLTLGALIVIAQRVLRLSTRSTLLLTAGAVCAELIAEAGLLAYLEIGESGTVALWAIQFAVIAGRLGIVVVALTGFVPVRGALSPSPDVSSRARRVSRRAALQ